MTIASTTEVDETIGSGLVVRRNMPPDIAHIGSCPAGFDGELNQIFLVACTLDVDYFQRTDYGAPLRISMSPF
jgi:hypothetical protein